MKIFRVRKSLIGMFAIIAAAGLSAAIAQQTPPAKGPSAKPLVQLDLTHEIDSVQSRVLRTQLTTYAPSASNTTYTHKDRPETVYMLSGKIIEHRGAVAKEYGTGDSFTAGKDPEHWIENKGTVPAVLLVTGI